MFRVNAEVRTVWVKDVVETTGKDKEGNEYKSKSILFRVASRRNYTRPVTKDGKTTDEYPTDYMLCRANGKVADIIANNCKFTDENGKLISRHLNIYGHIETFVQERKFTVDDLTIELNGEDISVDPFETVQKVDNYIFIVNDLEFLDPKPQKEEQQSTGTKAKATIKGKSTGTATKAKAKTKTDNAVESTDNNADAEENVQTMNTPDVPEGFTGEECPFL